MKLVGFDPRVARANGYPDDLPSRVTTFGVVTGSCGSSYVELYDVGTRKYSMDTGFGVKVSAVSYSWRVHVTAPGYSTVHRYSGPLAFRTTWTNSPNAVAVIPQGAYVTAVAEGTAVLANGFIGESLRPTDLQAIY